MANLTEWESPTPAPDPAAEFQRLLNQKELAAARLVAVVDTCVLFWEALDEAEVLIRLQRARADFYAVEVQIAKFRKQNSLGENTNHGNRTSAA